MMEKLILKLKALDVLSFEEYELDGYEMLVISDTGKQISKLEET